MQRYIYLAAIPAAFVAGVFVSHLTGSAQAQMQMQAPSSELSPQIIDLSTINDPELGNIVPDMGSLRSKTLVATANGTIALQTGNVPKHTHTYSDEIQYVISGSGTFWLGDRRREIHAGELIIIPKGTIHAGSEPSSGEFKVLSIKLPPQAPDDKHLMP